MGQIEIAANFTLAELKAMPDAIRQGRQTIPREPAPTPVAVTEPPPTTITVFMLRSAKYRDHDGRKRFAGQWEDATMPFIAHCDVVARDLLMPYGDVVIVLSTVLRIKRTLDGPEIDKIIWDVETRKAFAMERQRRADWCKRELAASRFQEECDHSDDAPLPHPAQDRVQ